MARLPNPHDNEPFDRVTTDQSGDPLYGFRREHTPDEEIVHIPTNRSNQAYYVPDVLMDPTGCEHSFIITSPGLREIECQHCHFATTFHTGINFHEHDGLAHVTLNGHEYPTRL